ncbi:MAG: 2'-5' RNA ligase family protein [Gemmatimonadetes bacterium]|nr:2'-5' RNA ligase family protein [Gemmatimonadota bacterium]
MSTNGIFITAELSGPVAAQVRELQRRFDPRLANELPPHITLLGSSGAGPIRADTSRDVLRAALEPVGLESSPVHVRFGAPYRFIGREIVILPLDPHGPLRTLHERLKNAGLSYELARYPFTPHCTLSFYPTLTPESLRALLAVRVDDPFVIDRLRVYHTRAPQVPVHLMDIVLTGAG